MTATDELRRMLDERGIEHDDYDPDPRYSGPTSDRKTEWDGASFREWPNGTIRFGAKGTTPAQAIAATVGRCETMELWPEWEQVLFANVSDEVAQDSLNECVHELLDKAATLGRSCESCPEMDNPDSYIRHLQSALKWHDEHVPRPTNPRNTCVVFQGERPPEEVLFVGPDGVTHYQPEGATADAGTPRIEDRHGDWYCTGCGEIVGTCDVTSELCIYGNAIYPWRYCPKYGRRIEVGE